MDKQRDSDKFEAMEEIKWTITLPFLFVIQGFILVYFCGGGNGGRAKAVSSILACFIQ